MNIRAGYQNFFIKSDEGQEFIKELNRERMQAYSDLENNPERAMYYSGKAKALSELLQHIEVTCIKKK
jgi:hypothetical protein